MIAERKARGRKRARERARERARKQSLLISAEDERGRRGTGKPNSSRETKLSGANGDREKIHKDIDFPCSVDHNTFWEVPLFSSILYHRRLLFLILWGVRRTFFPSGWCFFYLIVTTGWIFYISLYEKSINQSKRRIGNHRIHVWSSV